MVWLLSQDTEGIFLSDHNMFAGFRVTPAYGFRHFGANRGPVFRHYIYCPLISRSIPFCKRESRLPSQSRECSPQMTSTAQIFLFFNGTSARQIRSHLYLKKIHATLRFCTNTGDLGVRQVCFSTPILSKYAASSLSPAIKLCGYAPIYVAVWLFLRTWKFH